MSERLLIAQSQNICNNAVKKDRDNRRSWTINRVNRGRTQSCKFIFYIDPVDHHRRNVPIYCMNSTLHVSQSSIWIDLKIPRVPMLSGNESVDSPSNSFFHILQ
jgi:hypothetical protein